MLIAVALAAGLGASACSVYDPSLIARFDGSVSDAAQSDAAEPDADDSDAGGSRCIPSTEEFCPEICPETCNNTDDDCDSRVDEGTGNDLCALSNADAECVDGSCVVVGCTGASADCDGLPLNGCEVRLDSPDNCGFCGVQCSIPGASAICVQATCVFGACLPGFGDCDGNPGNGCELRVDTHTHCGACRVACGEVANGTAGCLDGLCGVAECSGGFGNCDMDVTNGCETTVDSVDNCGECGNVCSFVNGIGACSPEGCVLAGCEPSFADCDGEAENGCEVNIGNDLTNCGACARACDVGGSGGLFNCVDGGCEVSMCPVGVADCDGNPDNGCERPTDTLTDCASCDTTCAIPNANVSCADRTCRFVACAAGFADCNSNLNDGCETALNSDSNCASCGDACDVAGGRMCSGGVCSLVNCPSGTADCDNDGVDCEQSLSTLPHCGVCNSRCGNAQGRLTNATASCASGACEVGTCDATFANCDSAPANGCETSLRTTADCGACGTACSRANASATCATGSCAIDTCNTGFGNCDNNGANGCETALNTNSHCGGCGVTCAQTNATTSCGSGVCMRVSCDAGFGDCDGNASNGCETRLNTLTHCGACNAGCALSNASESCSTGTCTLGTCDAAFGNCDFIAGNGCETPLNTNTNCNACGTQCDYANGTETCASRTCTLTGCSSGYGNCDTNEANGCEQPLNTTNHCAACGVSCSRANATASCGGGSCALGACNTGFGNCDGNANNGCETSLGTTSNCSACGDVCGSGKPCQNFRCAGSFPYTTSNFDGNDSGITPVGAVSLSCGTSVFNSTTLAFSNWCGQPMPTPVVRSQSGGPDVVILAFDSLSISATLQVVGNRPVILAVYGDAMISGTLDANASGATPGAGGNWMCGTSRGTNGTFQTSEGRGGGGGGFGGVGGRGGNYSSSQLGGPGGVARGSSNLQPIFGGCDGGHGGGCTNGSAGGGAVQVSVAGTLTASGTVRANGATGGIECGGQSAGGGGGSGGAILMEANVMVANGVTVQATGGRGGNGNGGSGGNGSTTAGSPNGTAGATDNDGAGGGGGAYGRGYLRGVSSCTNNVANVTKGGTCN